jgi:hypothetical protein
MNRDRDASVKDRPRRDTPSLLWSKSPHGALEYEIAQEQASTLGRLGRRLEAALAALATFDADTAEPAGSPERRRQRSKLVSEAGVALWYFVVQREVLGLRDTPRVLRDYRVPDEVRDRIGIMPPRRR